MNKEVRVLNRIIRWIPQQGITMEEDPRHVDILVQRLQVDDMKALTAPRAKDEGEKEENKEDKIADVVQKKKQQQGAKGELSRHGKPERLLSPEDATEFRALTARANYLAIDRVDVGYAVKELTRRMSSPSKRDWDAQVSN